MPAEKPKKEKIPWTSAALGFFLLRLWIGLRLLIAGAQKFQGDDGNLAFANLKANADKFSGLIKDHANVLHGVLNSFFGIFRNPEEGAATPGWVTNFLNGSIDFFAQWMGLPMVIVGVMLILGILPRISLFLAGLIFIFLSIGLMCLDQSDAWIAYLGIHIGLVGYALSMARYSKLNLTPW